MNNGLYGVGGAYSVEHLQAQRARSVWRCVYALHLDSWFPSRQGVFDMTGSADGRRIGVRRKQQLVNATAEVGQHLPLSGTGRQNDGDALPYIVLKFGQLHLPGSRIETKRKRPSTAMSIGRAFLAVFILCVGVLISSNFLCFYL